MTQFPELKTKIESRSQPSELKYHFMSGAENMTLI